MQTTVLKRLSLPAALCCVTLAGSRFPAHSEPQNQVSSRVFHASFDGTLDATGISGAIKPLTVTGKVEYRPGKIGQALLCGGDAAQLTYPVEHIVRPSQGTIEMWVQPVDWTPTEQAMHVFFETTGPGWLVLYKFFSGGVLMLSGYDHNHYVSAWDQQAVLTNGQWHHLAGVWNHDDLSLYVDGVLKQTAPLPALPAALRDSFMLGDNPWTTPHASHTLIDEVNIYRYALPPDQIALAAQGKPVTYSRALPINVTPRPALNQLRVRTDVTGFLDDDSGGKVEVELLNNATVAARAEIGQRNDGVGVANVDMSHLAAGHYDVRANVTNAAGLQVATATTTFDKLPDAPWANNKLGLRDVVLPPYTPIQIGHGAAATTVSCWGRKYTLDGLFPSQIDSAGKGILAAPIKLTGTTPTSDIAFEPVLASIDHRSATRAHQHATGRAGPFAIDTNTSVEYDGMLWTELTITPRGSRSLNDLTLHIPLHAADSIYFHPSNLNWGQDRTGNIPEGGVQLPDFNCSLWLGNNDRGLDWFAETQQGWSNAAGKNAQEVVRKGDTTELQIHFINQPTQLDAPLHLSFGLQSTPIKPQTWDRGRRLGMLDEKTVDKLVGMGNIQTLWSNYYLKYYGYPQPQDDAKFRKLVADLHARHVLAIPYINLNFLSLGAPESAYYSPDWIDPSRRFATGDVAEMGYATDGACPHSAAWRDFITYKIVKFVDEYNVDGIYVDCWFPYGCFEDHDCGWHDATGNLQPRYPIRDYREIMRRVREVLTERRPNIHIIAHMSANVISPTLGFADSMLDGEQYQGARAPGDDYLNVIPLDKWRAEHDGIPFGVKPFFLPEFNIVNRTNTLPTQRLMALMLAHDISPWPIWCNQQVVFDTWKAMDRFGADKAQFLPYWKPTGVTTNNNDVVVSAYRQGNRAMLVVFNTSKQDAAVQVAVDTAQLGIGANFKATDLMSQTAVAGSGIGFAVDVAQRNFRLIEVGP